MNHPSPASYAFYTLMALSVSLRTHKHTHKHQSRNIHKYNYIHKINNNLQLSILWVFTAHPTITTDYYNC